MADVFISYKRRLRPRVEQIANSLSELGVSVWFDAALEPGTSFSAEISHEVRTATCVMVCWSDDTFPHGGDENGWVVGEATIGRARKVLIPVMLEPADLDPPWNTIHAEDLTRWTPTDEGEASRWRTVLTAIGRYLDRPGLADYDIARSLGTDAALRAWARAYPTDPLSPAVKKEVSARVRARRNAGGPRSKRIRRSTTTTTVESGGSDTLTETANVIAEELGLADDAVQPVEVPDTDLRWLERDAALSTDLSYEKTKLEDAVAHALDLPTLSPQAAERAAMPVHFARPRDRSIVDERSARLPSMIAQTLGVALGLVASAAVMATSARIGASSTPVGHFATSLVSVGAYAAATLGPSWASGKITALRMVLLALALQAFASGSWIAAVLASTFVPAPLAAPIYGLVGSVIGTFASLCALVAGDVLPDRPILQFVGVSFAVALPTVVLEGAHLLGTASPQDTLWTMVLWQLAFAVAILLLRGSPKAA